MAASVLGPTPDPVPPTSPPDLEDMQAILYSGYSTLKGAVYVLLRINDAVAARAWLARLEVTSVERARQETLSSVVQIAFTARGLTTLGLEPDALRGFSLEFYEGMTTRHRQRILGDEGDLAPARWEWGGPGTDPVHIVLMLFAAREAIAALYDVHRAGWSSGCAEVRRLDTIDLPKEKEHFGFHDGISAPPVEGLTKDTPATAPQLGEFVLGYKNAYGVLPDSPSVAAGTKGAQLLPDGPSPGTKDLGRNGTYLVFRQLEQDVFGFWSFLCDRAGPDRIDEAVWLGSKMVGRWPNGAPLVLHPDREPAQDPEPENNFSYRDADPSKNDDEGRRCPFGAHIRRTNPRDSLDPGPAESRITSSRHSMLRRGRAYGLPLAEDMTPTAFLRAAEERKALKRGLHFICLNADIARQFEFVQQTWVMNPKFQGLTADPDPLIAPHPSPEAVASGAAEGNLTIPRNPVRRRVTGLSRFVSMRGGAYFFVPGLRALRYLAGLA
jgi:Dyp-type peroxidase family